MHRASQDNEGLTSLSMAQNVNSAEAEKPSSRPKSKRGNLWKQFKWHLLLLRSLSCFHVLRRGSRRIVNAILPFQVYEWCTRLKSEEGKWHTSSQCCFIFQEDVRRKNEQYTNISCFFLLFQDLELYLNALNIIFVYWQMYFTRLCNNIVLKCSTYMNLWICSSVY